MNDRSTSAKKGATVAPGAKRAAELPFDPIDAALRQIHDRVTAERIPDEFFDLLDQLDQKDKAGSAS